MSRRKINQKIKQLKRLILRMVEECIEPALWQELIEPRVTDGKGNYHIYDDDLPCVRDLKAFMNILSAIERMTESYSLYAISFFKTMELPLDYLDYRRNYKLYMSTNSIVGYYFSIAKEYTYNTIFPYVSEKLQELFELCTNDNFQLAAEFFIEQIISLEQYPEKYEKSKRMLEKGLDDKAEQREGIFTTLVRKNDYYLRKFYKDKYEVHFAVTKKDENQTQEVLWDYYSENTKDNETIRHIKKLANGVVGIKKVLDDYDSYKRAGTLSSVSWFATFIADLRKAYNYLQEFEYQAIIAEQAKPLADYIKELLKDLNKALEKLAVLMDQYEGEGCFRETVLLRYVELLLKRYDQMTIELKIPIDYGIQRRVYYKSRVKAREQYLQDIRHQIESLTEFLKHKDFALAEIPVLVRNNMKKFILKYEDDICMDRANLAKYKNYLDDAAKNSMALGMFLINRIEYAGNYCGLTVHHELMSSFRKRKLYLEKQEIFLTKRLNDLKDYSEKNPYDYFNVDDIKSMGYLKVISDVLKEHIKQVTAEKDSLMYATVGKEPSRHDLESLKIKLGIAIEPVTPDVKTTAISKTIDTKLIDPKIIEVKTKPKNVRERLLNQIMTKTKEHGVLVIALEQFEKSKDVSSLLALLRKEECLGMKSLLLLDEIEDIIKTYNKNPPAIIISITDDIKSSSKTPSMLSQRL
jgi:hypothetical protein